MTSGYCPHSARLAEIAPVTIDTVTPFLRHLAERGKLDAAHREIADVLRHGIQSRQASQTDIHGTRFKRRDTDGYPRNDYQRQRQSMPLFPFLTRDAHLRSAFAAPQVQVGFVGRAATLAAANNAGAGAPRRELVGFSEPDLQAVQRIIAKHLQQ